MSVLNMAAPTGQGSGLSPRRSGRRSRRWGMVLLAGGVAFFAAAFAYGSIAYGSLGNDLKPVPLGDQVTFRPSGSYLADIFIGEPATARPATCSVITTDGRSVPVNDANPYVVSRKFDMQANYGFDLSSGASYLITCGSRADTGRFAVVEVPIRPRVVATVLMVPTVLAFVTGLVLVVVARRQRRSASNASGGA